MTPSNENTLFLIIKQTDFDAILTGRKKQEEREINYTAYTKYLKTEEDGNELCIYYDKDTMLNKISAKNRNNPMIYNNGVYPFIAIDYKFLNLTSGYEKDSDSMIIAVKSIHFEPMKTKEGKDARFSHDGERMIIDQNGELCIWLVVYTLGNLIKTDLKNKQKTV